MGTRNRNFPTLDPAADLTHMITPETQKVLNRYSQLPPEDLTALVRSVATKAWEITPYPCIGFFWFLRFEVTRLPIYSDILSRVKGGDVFLDLGCGFGQDIRRLAFDGAPTENMIGLELRREYVDLGFELFRDKAHLKAEFVVQDFFDEGLVALPWVGKVNVIHSGYFMHMWDWEGQVRVAKRMIGLLALKKGDVIMGIHFGSRETGEWRKNPVGGTNYFHDSGSFRRLWDQVARETGTEWGLEIAEEVDEYCEKVDKDGFYLLWSATLEKSTPKCGDCV